MSNFPCRNESSISPHPRSPDQRHEALFELIEDLSHLRRLHVRLEIVGEDVVRLVGRIKPRRSGDAIQVLLEMRPAALRARHLFAGPHAARAIVEAWVISPTGSGGTRVAFRSHAV
jgi:hypothetical protein